MKKKLKFFVLILLIEGISMSSREQVTVTGPTCVMAGTVYQYTIAGNWDSISTLNVCVSGGMIADSADRINCTPTGAPVANVLVTWNNGGTGSLTVTSSIGNGFISVVVSAPLIPGIIDSASMTQMIGYDSIPTIITCSMDVGGACNPIYSYQWQQSEDMVNWSDLPGDTLQSLSIDSGLTQSTYYRRKVTETTSGTIGYSNAAIIFVGGPTTNFLTPPNLRNSLADRQELACKAFVMPLLMNDFKSCFII